jgi:hypothetical protein
MKFVFQEGLVSLYVFDKFLDVKYGELCPEIYISQSQIMYITSEIMSSFIHSHGAIANALNSILGLGMPMLMPDARGNAKHSIKSTSSLRQPIIRLGRHCTT